MPLMRANPEVDELREQVIGDFFQVWELNDPAHRVKHFEEVEHCANHINDSLRLGYDPKLIMLVAYFHDMFAWSRDNHHLMSGEWIMTTSYPVIAALDPEERLMVAAGCREHRASNTQPFTCGFAQLMSSADRGFPDLSLRHMTQRAIEYRLHKGLGTTEARKGAIRHLKEKFGTNGYANYPAYYQAVFKAELQKQRELVDVL